VIELSAVGGLKNRFFYGQAHLFVCRYRKRKQLQYPEDDSRRFIIHKASVEGLELEGLLFRLELNAWIKELAQFPTPITATLIFSCNLSFLRRMNMSV